MRVGDVKRKDMTGQKGKDDVEVESRAKAKDKVVQAASLCCVPSSALALGTLLERMVHDKRTLSKQERLRRSCRRLCHFDLEQLLGRVVGKGEGEDDDANGLRSATSSPSKRRRGERTDEGEVETVEKKREKRRQSLERLLALEREMCQRSPEEQRAC